MTDTSQGSASNEVVLAVHDASFAYEGRTVLTGIDFEVRAGEAVALIGPNGSGKSTLLKGILGSLDVVSGSVSIAGSPPGSRSRRLIGYLPQEDSRSRDVPVTVAQVVMMGRYRGLGWFRMPGRRDRAAVRQALEVVGLAGLARERFDELSGGQQRRVILARALVAEPRILLLDEPFNGLDRENRDALMATLVRLKERGVAALISTHDFDLARLVCEQVLLLNGYQVAFGPQERMLAVAQNHEAFSEAAASHVHPPSTDERG